MFGTIKLQFATDDKHIEATVKVEGYNLTLTNMHVQQFNYANYDPKLPSSTYLTVDKKIKCNVPLRAHHSDTAWLDEKHAKITSAMESINRALRDILTDENPHNLI